MLNLPVVPEVHPDGVEVPVDGILDLPPEGVLPLGEFLDLVQVVGIAVGPDYRDRQFHGVVVGGHVVSFPAWAIQERVPGLVVHSVSPHAHGLEMQIELEVDVACPRGYRELPVDCEIAGLPVV